MKVKKEEQKKQFEAVKLKVKQVKRNKKPLYKLLEESFENQLKDQEDARKKILDQIRHKKAPLDINKLKEHTAKHDKFV